MHNIVIAHNYIKTTKNNIIQPFNVIKTNINSIQYKPYQPIVWDPYMFDDTVIANNGTFATADEAIAAAVALGYSNVEPIQLSNGSYIWYSTECLIKPPPSTTPAPKHKKPTVLYGWKQGG